MAGLVIERYVFDRRNLARPKWYVVVQRYAPGRLTLSLSLSRSGCLHDALTLTLYGSNGPSEVLPSQKQGALSLILLCARRSLVAVATGTLTDLSL